MPKPSKQVIIDAIIKEIETGTERGKVVAKFCKKFQKSTRTIDTYWKTANEQHIVKQQEIKKELDEVDKQMAIESRKKAILSADERKEYLTKIITAKTDLKKIGNMHASIWEKEDGTKEIIDVQDKLKALAELNKMDGDYAPTKIAQTDTEGNDIKSQSDDELQMRLKKLESIVKPAKRKNNA